MSFFASSKIWNILIFICIMEQPDCKKEKWVGKYDGMLYTVLLKI